MTLLTAGEISNTDRWFRYWMPYCFQKLATNHKHVFLPLNRNYKPLGVVQNDYLEYEEYIDQAVIFSADPYAFKDIWTKHLPDKLFLYDDAPKTRLDYFDRLGRLLNRAVRLVSKINKGSSNS